MGFAWQYEIDTEHGFEATPIVVDDVMYSSGPDGAVYAVDAGTGTEMWKFEPEVDPEFIRKASGKLGWQAYTTAQAAEQSLQATAPHTPKADNNP